MSTTTAPISSLEVYFTLAQNKKMFKPLSHLSKAEKELQQQHKELYKTNCVKSFDCCFGDKVIFYTLDENEIKNGTFVSFFEENYFWKGIIKTDKGEVECHVGHFIPIV